MNKQAEEFLDKLTDILASLQAAESGESFQSRFERAAYDAAVKTSKEDLAKIVVYLLSDLRQAEPELSAEVNKYASKSKKTSS